MIMTNYSFATSLPAYQDNASTKQKQSEAILSLIKSGVNNLLMLSEVTGLPQSTVSGRCNDLITEGKIFYSGFVTYNNRKRKKILAKVSIEQKELF